MSICKNTYCGARLTEYQWGDGYCSKYCMEKCLDRGERISDYIHDPTDPTGRRSVAKTSDEVDAFLEAYAIDPRLPKIIYLRKRGNSFRQIGMACRIAESMVRKILEKCSPNLLLRCGLRKKSRSAPRIIEGKMR